MGDIAFLIGTVCGNNLVDDSPELKYTGSGKAVTNFSIRVHGQKANEKYGREAREAYFLECAAWDQLAENVAESLKKGDRVVIQGLHGERSFTTKTGEERTVKTFTCWDVGLSLCYVKAEVTGTTHETPESKAAEDAGLETF